MWYALWKLKMRSSSHTLPKYRSSTSTKWWIVSSTMSSLSSSSTHAKKYREAYLNARGRGQVGGVAAAEAAAVGRFYSATAAWRGALAAVLCACVGSSIGSRRRRWHTYLL